MNTELPLLNPSLLPIKPLIEMTDTELNEFQDRVRKHRLSQQTLREHFGGEVVKAAKGTTKKQVDMSEYV
jgi:hypothetical protein